MLSVAKQCPCMYLFYLSTVPFIKLRPICVLTNHNATKVRQIRSNMHSHILARATELCRKALESPTCFAHTCVAGGAYWICLLFAKITSLLCSHPYTMWLCRDIEQRATPCLVHVSLHPMICHLLRGISIPTFSFTEFLHFYVFFLVALYLEWLLDLFLDKLK